jgi:dTDP-glucose 4,6-dehydratase
MKGIASRATLVTGGCGFIGSNFVRYWLRNESGPVVNLDKLTYAGNAANLSSIASDPRYTFVRGDICNSELVSALLDQHQPTAVFHFAAESHVDRSILGPEEFVMTNVVGTLRLLRSTLAYWQRLDHLSQQAFRFVHVSTDEVFGSLSQQDPAFTEQNSYAPNSPYAASKASSDHFVRAWNQTYGLPTITTHCSNNYGPYQFPEKLIPLLICNALSHRKLPIYGDGLNVRDWLYVEDHCSALRLILNAGTVGSTYNIGGGSEKTNLEIVESVCAELQELHAPPDGSSYRDLITFVPDRLGHDRRYSIDAGRISRELGWAPRETFLSGLRKTVRWYLGNADWLKDVRSDTYLNWVQQNYENRTPI